MPIVQRLPDLPNAGYATSRQRLISDGIMTFMRAIERDRRTLLAIVIEGKLLFRQRMKAVWSAFDAEISDAMYGYFCLQAGKHPKEQLAKLNRMEVGKVLHWDKRTATQQKWDKYLMGVLSDLKKSKTRA